DGKVELSWGVPAGLSSQVAAETHNFDDPALSWNTSIPGWIFYDGDKATIGGIGSKTLPVSGRQSFFVMDNTYAAIQGSQFAAHSGNQFLCSMYVMQGQKMIQSDDWAISPELTGDPQTISLWASSFKADPDQTQYLETFEILYSTTGTNIEDFKLIEEFKAIPPMWTEYTAYLPEGAKYFAIRCTSYDQYMLFVDDVKFRAKNGPLESVDITGYNVYRDRVKLTAEPVAVTAYTDEPADGKSTYTYAVTAVYPAGESHISNEVVVDMSQSGLDPVEVGGFAIRANDGAVEILGAEGKSVLVAALDGTTVYSGTGAAVTRVPVTPGLYLVTVADTTVKLLVK
ncbi:MAG: choice-of-anchor J domain-containing protein, partial [[Clostridium] fimetarium]|nr:choice-of-anchor J domain-containing protein [[Clostridium] fimetarium]